MICDAIAYFGVWHKLASFVIVCKLLVHVLIFSIDWLEFTNFTLYKKLEILASGQYLAYILKKDHYNKKGSKYLRTFPQNGVSDNEKNTVNNN